jgi:hypothetical protein
MVMPIDCKPFHLGDLVKIEFYNGEKYGHLEQYDTPHWVSVKLLDGKSRGTHLQRLSHITPEELPQPLTPEKKLAEELTTVSCQVCNWTMAAPKDEALTILRDHLESHNPPKIGVTCATCGKPAGREAVVHNKKSYCVECGTPLLGEKEDPTLYIKRLKDAPDQDTPAPRPFEQPVQPEIPMKQLSLFGD